MNGSANGETKTKAKSLRPGDRLEMRVGEEVDESSVMFYC